MAKVSKKYEDMTVEEKTKKVERRIKVLFREIPKEKRQFVDALIYQFSVTTVTLERLPITGPFWRISHKENSSSAAKIPP